uniref:Sm domain-containing protein n=1 Tax=Globisporangium ultimum (strain ATCC 200006 / CBS 805.95 / DAOM BR144) TaxID=431595 RepID=K3WE98_GLOUD
MNAPQQLHGDGRGRSTVLTTASATAPPATDPKQPQKKRKQSRLRTLLLLLKSLVGLRIRIDLKNDSTIEGIVQEVVHDMDFTMINACETKTSGKMVRMDEVFVMGKTVLYVHIPDRINLTQHLQQYAVSVVNSVAVAFAPAVENWK